MKLWMREAFVDMRLWMRKAFDDVLDSSVAAI
jgi:hypothetical protein